MSVSVIFCRLRLVVVLAVTSEEYSQVASLAHVARVELAVGVGTLGGQLNPTRFVVAVFAQAPRIIFFIDVPRITMV